MIKSFNNYLVEEEGTVYFAFGRMNPPTVGHGKLLDKLASIAGRNPYRIYLSQSQDKNKNPLSYTDKVKFVRKIWPKHARSVILDKKVKTMIDAAVILYNEGFVNLVVVAGSDRLREFDILLNKYNGVKSRHGFYNFKSIKVVSAGERDPDADDVTGMSASKMRAFISDNDFTKFSQGLPTSTSNQLARKIFNSVRSGMGLKEASKYHNHIQLDSVSETREKYVSGELFEVGDLVEVKSTGEEGTVAILGTNYVIVEFDDQSRKRLWLDGVQKLEEGINDPSIFKVIFLAGGPGSGKSFIAGKTALAPLGFRVVNSDDIYERDLKKAGLTSMPDDVWSPKGQEIRTKSKHTTASRQATYLKGRLGLVIDGTGKDLAKVTEKAQTFKSMGYDIAMIFVNTSLHKAIHQDTLRDRSLGDKEVTRMWNKVQDNLGGFQRLFNNHFYIIDNTDPDNWKTETVSVYKSIRKWAAQPPKSQKAKKWIDAQKKERGIKEDCWYPDQPEWGRPESTRKAKKLTPGEVQVETITVDQVRDRINKEKDMERQRDAREKEKEKMRDQQMAKKHDRLIDRVRRARTMRVNQGLDK